GVRVEGADRFDGVVEQIEAVRYRRAHGEKIEQAAANAELARRGHLLHVLVIGEDELLAQRRLIQPVALAKRKRVRRKKGGRRNAVQRGGDGNGEHVHMLLHEGVQRLQALRYQVLVRRERVI